ncbi:VOC family protein [Pseudonocardia abyssalis]|jgi:uncharacterized glyoxalase superfamily protein PhnB|uniref:VOC family protein n=1 Tax=Pseudonocardia abyssalis TaxID=2792008 RepID=A0ABS6UZS9_9PSEU|nr:VOC family protein [Pseudonocardia abyssalis]MBW0117563.1 VOC family protein [Pseudonocardia abyssalis]MBW0137486.1 VOC family protein [Pseudonocardia abyssalis]
MTETTPRPVALHLLLAYRDAPAALRWLERAFGFETINEFPDDHGGITHAEARRDAAVVVVFSDDGAGYDHPVLRGETTGRGAYLSVPDEAAVDAVFVTATAAGAVPVWKPHHSEWNYRCRVLDPEGNEWTFAIVKPGEAVY